MGFGMGWYKIFSGLPQEAKLAVVARRTGVRRGEVLALWVALLDHASAARPRGYIKDIDHEELAAVLEFDVATVKTIIDVLHDRKMILPDGMLSGWSRDQKLSTPRTRTYRARLAVAAAVHETDAARRARLQNKMNAGRKQRGHAFAEQP